MKTRKQSATAVIVWLVIAVLLIGVGSFLANRFMTGQGSVKVSRVKFDTETGTLSGLLYMPKGAGAEDPRPALVTTHGYLNSAEMQDAQSIEMARRGYVVLALDMYDHGHSAANADKTGGFLNFWPSSIFDGVKYIYGQDYVLKDEAGNGLIAVSGHSMGSFSSEMALYYDELAYQETGVRMIYAGLSTGSDYSYTGWLGLDAATAAENFSGRWIGKIAAQFDEFFFNAEGDTGTVNHKDYVNTAEGAIILEREGALPNTWYNTSDGGHRVIYQPYETHPWNHFSLISTAHCIDFYQTAFADVAPASVKVLDINDQVWLYKELAECLALLGLLILIAQVMNLLLMVPGLEKAVGDDLVFMPASENFAGKLKSFVLFVLTMLIPALIFPVVYDGNAGAYGMKNIQWIACGAVVLALICLISGGRSENKASWRIGGLVMLLASAGLYYLAGHNIFATGKIFQAPSINSIVYWAVICALISTIIMITLFLIEEKKEKGASLASYGGKISVAGCFGALGAAILTVVIAYGCVFLIDLIFKTDFRIWTFAIKTFEPSAILASLKYMPFFLIYYLAAGMAAVSNSGTEKLQGFGGYIVACLTNMGGILIWLIAQYGQLFATGHGMFPTQALSGILLFALVPTLMIASIYSKYFYKKTGNIYAAAFLNTILMTLMSVANTTVYFQR